MLESARQSVRYYFFSLSNLLAAVGGGMILGKGVAIIQIPILRSGSILAFFVGTVFGLLLLQCAPKKLSKSFSRWFSVCGGLTSLVLLSIFVQFNVNETLIGNPAVLFFALLSMRFGFWFYSRVLRAADAAGKNQRIAWVEFGYYSGVIIGLVLWLLLGLDIGMTFTLLLDAALQFLAGILDFLANNIRTNKPNQPQQVAEKVQEVQDKNHTKAWAWRLAIAVMLLTVGVQVIVFNLAHQVSSTFSPYMLAIFYLGAAVSSVFCKRFNIRLEWNLSKENKGYATILFGRSGNVKEINFLLLNVLAAGSVAAAILMVYWYFASTNKPNLVLPKEFCLLAFIFMSTFFYETIALAILDRIGLEEKSSQHQGMILRTYGIMSIAAAVSLWLLDIVHGSIFYLISTLIFCFLLTFISVWKRKFIYT